MAEKGSETTSEDGKYSQNYIFQNTNSSSVIAPYSGNTIHIDSAKIITTACADCTDNNYLLDIPDGRKSEKKSSASNFSVADKTPTFWEKFLQFLPGSSKIITKKLKNLYSDLQIPTPVWIEERPECLIEDYFITLELKSTNEEIAINSIFKNNIKNKRILLEGKPGFGKTTLVTKIANDWALNKKYLDKFEFLFLLQMRYLREKTIEEGIIDEAKRVGLEDKEIETIRKINKRNILVIIDGLDESTPNQRESILKVLYKQMYPEMTVLVTCRTGYFTLNRDEEQRLFGGKSKSKKFFDSEIKVQGITENNRKKFLCTFTSLNEKYQEEIEHILEEKKFQLDIFDSPLLLCLLADFVNEALKEQQEINLTSITNFYKMIFNLIIKRSEERNENPLKVDFDIFNENEMTKPYRQLLNQFGSVSIDNILKNELVFSESDLITKIQQLGFVVKQRNVTHTRCTTSFEVFHLSILEFVVAFYLFQDFERNNFNDFNPVVEHKMNEIFIQSGKTSLIFPFLMGLFKDKVVNFFQVIKPHSYIYSFDTDVLFQMVQNMDISEDCESQLLQILQYFLPSGVIIDNKCSTQLWQRLIFKRIDDLGVDSVAVKDYTKCGLELSSVAQKIPLFWLVQEGIEFVNFPFVNLPVVKRGVDVSFFHNEMSVNEDGEEYFNFSPEYEKKLSNFNGNILKEILKDINIDIFNYSSFCIENFELFEKLLYLHKLTSLTISTYSFPSLRNVIPLLYRLNSLDSVNLLNFSKKIVFIDLKILTEQGQKQWKNICLYNISFICNMSHEICINNFSCTGYDFSNDLDLVLTNVDSSNKTILSGYKSSLLEGKKINSLDENERYQMYLSSVESLKNVIITSLQVNVSYFFSALETSDKWVKNSLQDLVLKFDTDCDYEIAKSIHNWQQLNSLSQLQFLGFEFYNALETPFLPVEEIVQCISCLSIIHLSLSSIEYKGPFVINLISNLQNSKTIHIKNLSLFACKYFRECEEIVQQLFILLNSKFLDKFSLVSTYDTDVWRMSLFKAIENNSKNICVEHDILGSDNTDPLYIKYYYVNGYDKDTIRFSITLS